MSDVSNDMSDATSSSSLGSKAKSKGKGKAKASPAVPKPPAKQSSLAGFSAGSAAATSRPMLKTASSGSGNIGNIKTAAETAREVSFTRSVSLLKRAGRAHSCELWSEKGGACILRQFI